MRPNMQMDSLITNETSLLQMLAAHPGSFVHSNRHIIIRKRFLQAVVPAEDNPKLSDAIVKFVEKPLPISRRRLHLVQRAL